MAEWQEYPATAGGAAHTVVGNIRLLERLHSPQLGNGRHILVYLPPSYESTNRRYPVIYMHDGQNLFDAGTSFAGEWAVDQTLEAASGHGLECIVVGIPNMGADRVHEYSPFRDSQRGGGKGEPYLRFITETLKPIVDADFRTRAGREHTGIAGSSLGALISLYGFFRHPDVFGFAGVMSPALWFAGGAILPWVARQPFVGGRIYIDAGLREGTRVVADLKHLRDILQTKGYRQLHDLLCVIDTAGDHSERAWGRRLRRELHFLLGVPRSRAASGA
jgi:predicted alpha/beta superfamily hydrolase